MAAIPNNLANREKDESFYAQQNLPGVKYIKISRYDAFGNDNYQSLRELDNIRINTTDRGIINYPVVAITEYPSSSLNSPYFLYQTVTTNITSSTNNQILNYRVSASRNVSFNMNINTEVYLANLTESVDNLNYFNPTTGIYTLGNTPNIPLIYTASVQWNGSSNSTRVYAAIALLNNQGTALEFFGGGYSSYTTSLSTFTFSGSFTPIEGQQYQLYIANFSGYSFSINTASLSFTQSISPVADIGAQTILEPYITTPFINSDYDSLINNAYVNRTSTVYMDVDYSDSNQVTPVNLRTILSSSAVAAPVQDSNYTTQRVISSRYEGKQLQSFKFNKYTEGDISYGKTPNVSNPQTYFTQFNWLAGTLPEWGTFGGESKIYSSTKYITDENENNIKPVTDSEGVNLSIIRQTFEEGKNATIQLSNPEAFGTDMSSLNGTFPIFKSGKKIKPIIYTQVAQYNENGGVSGYNYTGSINFTDGDILNSPPGSNVNDYRLMTFVPLLDTYTTTFLPNRVFEINKYAITESFPKEINFNSPIQLGTSASFTTSSGLTNPSTGSIYKPTGSLGQLSGSGYILYLEAFLKVNSNLRNLENIGGVIINFALQKSIDEGNNWDDLAIHNPYFPGTNPSFSTDFYLKCVDRSATTSSLYRVAALSRGGGLYAGYGLIQVADGSYFKVTQCPSPNTGNVNSFWMTGSNSNLLFAKKGTGGNIGLNDVFGQKQQDINNSGFDPILLDFKPQPYDEIRFTGTETQTYTILQVSQSLTSSAGIPPYQSLTLILDKNISSNINTDFFLLRRYVDDVGSIILSTAKPAGGTSTGIMKPEYVTSQTENVINNIISSFES
jgi:hypothetical protein